MKAALVGIMWLGLLPTAAGWAVEPVTVRAARAIQQAQITGGLVAQVGSDDLALKELGPRFHVRLLLTDPEAVARAQAAIDKAGLTGRFTAEVWTGGRLPFAERLLNALVVATDGLVADDEARRALMPRGLLITPAATATMPVPETMDEWTHYLYDATGNAVSKDCEVAPPKSLRWWVEPHHLPSHNYGASFTGLVTSAGRLRLIPNGEVFLALDRKARAGQLPGIDNIGRFYTDGGHVRAGLPRFTLAATCYAVMFGEHPGRLDPAIYNDKENYRNERLPQPGYVHWPDLGELIEITPERKKIVADTIWEVVSENRYTCVRPLERP